MLIFLFGQMGVRIIAEMVKLEGGGNLHSPFHYTVEEKGGGDSTKVHLRCVDQNPCTGPAFHLPLLFLAMEFTLSDFSEGSHLEHPSISGGAGGGRGVSVY